MFVRLCAAVAALLLLGPAAAAPASQTVTAKAAAPRVLRVMPLGDSITFGLGDPHRNSYRAALKSRLAANGVAIDFVGSQRTGTFADSQHEGHGGWTIAQLSARAPGWVRAYKPDVVLVMAGTNDVARRDRVASAGGRLMVLVNSIRKARPGVKVIVATIPQMLVRDDRVALWSSYKSQVMAATARLGAGFAPGHRVYQRDLADALHPSPCGYAKMGWIWFYGWTTTFNPPPGRVWDAGMWPAPICT